MEVKVKIKVGEVSSSLGFTFDGDLSGDRIATAVAEAAEFLYRGVTMESKPKQGKPKQGESS